MRRPRLVVGSILMTLALLAPGTEAAKKLRVVATIPDLKSLTEAVGGDLVEVDALTRGTQNFHEAEVRPSMMLKLRRADALIENGVELDAWADVAVLGANNPNIVRGAAGRIEISRGISLLEVPSTRVDRSMGDVHPLGNPHRSEEHTSELQSHSDLVCRLLLEKKKKINNQTDEVKQRAT